MFSPDCSVLCRISDLLRIVARVTFTLDEAKFAHGFFIDLVACFWIRRTVRRHEQHESAFPGKVK